MCTAVQSFHGCHRRKYRELGNAQQSFGSLVLFFFQCLALKIKFLLYNISYPQSLGLSHTPASQPQGSWEYKCQYAKIKPQLRYNDDCPSLPLSTEGNKKQGGKHRGQAETSCENTMWQIQGFKKVQHGPGSKLVHSVRQRECQGSVVEGRDECAHQYPQGLGNQEILLKVLIFSPKWWLPKEGAE